MTSKPEKATVDEAIEEESKIKKHTILLVDDEKDNLTWMANLLSTEYDVLIAKDGQGALKLIQNDENPERIHLILSDQRMPQMTGVEFLKRTIPIIPKTIRMIVTGFTDFDSIVKSINDGQVYKFLSKPIDVQELSIAVKRALEVYELEAQNVLLMASNRKLNELNQTKTRLLQTFNTIYEKDLKMIANSLKEGIKTQHDLLGLCKQNAKRIETVRESIRPVTQMYLSEKKIQSKRILLAESNKKQQIIAKMALGGTGVSLSIASDLTIGRQLIAEEHYDILCVNSELIELTPVAHKKNPKLHSVFMTSEDAPNYLSMLKQYPMISNIVSRDVEDRTFTLKNILTTVSKLLNNDLFGLEKYMNWGVDIQESAIVRSDQRTQLIGTMETYFKKLGVRGFALRRCIGVVEELLMNAIYDAPISASGKPVYNNLPRTELVVLQPSEQGTFRYACDGMLVGVSVEDPFGAFDRPTLLGYLENCYSGKIDTMFKKKEAKGGAGLGLFLMIKTADLVVWNVKPQVKTEIIALFNVDPNLQKNNRGTSFHYFMT